MALKELSYGFYATKEKPMVSDYYDDTSEQTAKYIAQGYTHVLCSYSSRGDSDVFFFKGEPKLLAKVKSAGDLYAALPKVFGGASGAKHIGSKGTAAALWQGSGGYLVLAYDNS